MSLVRDRRGLLGVALLFAVLVSGAEHTPGLAAGTATTAGVIQGRVVDAVGQRLPAVSVTMLPESGGSAQHATTGGDGAYRLAVPGPGLYRVDFSLLGFDTIRQNRVRVVDATPTRLDATLPVSDMCECIEPVVRVRLAQVDGQVRDGEERPLPHARVEIITPEHREARYADAEGRFRVRVAPDDVWQLTASDTGFHAETQAVFGSLRETVVFKLNRDSTATVPETERLDRGCRCPGDLFAHKDR